ncbi:hypothetical protein D9741_20245 [Escherichia sp. E14V7]|nr:hypothetical protein D9740_21790 [Escherichia sp. E14V5]RZN00782.1 hypothetical protein D9741_20245 [Escherichia sp. E14V7]RZN18232.1 hypothetical protein D9734_18565 [Escherichia sp. E14S1]RZN23624.1 hypothetical protein D9739_22140 [Escherichia sp. E14V10]
MRGQIIYLEFYYKYQNAEIAMDPSAIKMDVASKNILPKPQGEGEFTDTDGSKVYMYKYSFNVPNNIALGDKAIDLTLTVQALGAAAPVTCHCQYYVLESNTDLDDEITISFDDTQIIDLNAPETLNDSYSNLSGVTYITGTITYKRNLTKYPGDETHQDIQLYLRPVSMAQAVFENVFFMMSDTNQGGGKAYPDMQYHYVSNLTSSKLDGFVINLKNDSASKTGVAKFRIYPCAKDAGFLVMTVSSGSPDIDTSDSKGLFIEGITPEYMGYSMYFENTDGDILDEDQQKVNLHFKSLEDAESKPDYGGFINDTILVFNEPTYVDLMGTAVIGDRTFLGRYEVPSKPQKTIYPFEFDTTELMVQDNVNKAKNRISYIVAEHSGNVGISEHKRLIVTKAIPVTPPKKGTLKSPTFIDVSGTEMVSGGIINKHRIGNGLPGEHMYYRIPVAGNLTAGDVINTKIELSYYDDDNYVYSNLPSRLLHSYEIMPADVTLGYLQVEVMYEDLCNCNSDPFGTTSSKLIIWYETEGNAEAVSSTLILNIDTVM